MYSMFENEPKYCFVPGPFVPPDVSSSRIFDLPDGFFSGSLVPPNILYPDVLSGHRTTYYKTDKE
jgi:hypothetical protein